MDEMDDARPGLNAKITVISIFDVLSVFKFSIMEISTWTLLHHFLLLAQRHWEETGKGSNKFELHL